MSDVNALPELKQIVGALLFVSKQPLSVTDIRRVLAQVAEVWGGSTRDFAQATEADIQAVVDRLRADLAEKRPGIHVTEIANGFRFENDSSCGPWLRHLLERGRPNRLSRPALETLAIVAYRQPVLRSEIEAVRGVQVDQIIRNLLDMQLIKIVGRSELPGRPWQFGTTQKFLEHFGLKDLTDLPGTEELRRMEDEQLRRTKDEGENEREDDDEVGEPTVEGEQTAVKPTGSAIEESQEKPLSDIVEDEEEEDDDEEDEDDDEEDEDDEEEDGDDDDKEEEDEKEKEGQSS
jgi:segregation and condensation protein B